MRNLLILIVLAVFVNSCVKTDCVESDIQVIISYDSATLKLYYKVSQYEKGYGFNSLITSRNDSITGVNTNGYWFYSNTSFYISSQYDWVIEFPETGKVYKISDIHYSGRKKLSELHIMGEYRTRCFRETHYSMNGSQYTIERGTYEKGYSYRQPEITITK